MLARVLRETGKIYLNRKPIMTETTNEQPKEPTTLTFNDKEYLLSELSDQSKILVNHLQSLNVQVGEARMKLDQLEAAKTTFANMLETELEGDKETPPSVD